MLDSTRDPLIIHTNMMQHRYCASCFPEHQLAPRATHPEPNVSCHVCCTKRSTSVPKATHTPSVKLNLSALRDPTFWASLASAIAGLVIAVGDPSLAVPIRAVIAAIGVGAISVFTVQHHTTKRTAITTAKASASASTTTTTTGGTNA